MFPFAAQCPFLRGAVFLVAAIVSAAASGHGTQYEVLTEGVVGVTAKYDSGAPLGGARVLIFEPGQTRPSHETTTDSHGTVCFRPTQAGTWVLQILAEGGHGVRVNLDVSEDMIATGGGRRPSLTQVQRLVLAACVVWGFIGTALYVKSRTGGTG